MNLIDLTYKDIDEIHPFLEDVWYYAFPSVVPVDMIDTMLNTMYSKEGIAEKVKAGMKMKGIRNDKLEAFASFYPDTGKVQMLYIHQSFHGKGVGSYLLNKVEKEMKTEFSWLRTNRKNINAINFYFKNSYKIREAVDEPIDNGFVMEDYIMSKDLRR